MPSLEDPHTVSCERHLHAHHLAEWESTSEKTTPQMGQIPDFNPLRLLLISVIRPAGFG